jgi:2-oxoglutarate dehydrogenase E2 component (dihydrolipoamide succinyltransferase)
MPTPVRLPNLGAEASEARILAWRHGVGDRVVSGELIAEVETDKATVDLEAPVSGRLSEILAPEGAEVPVGAIIAMIEDV